MVDDEGDGGEAFFFFVFFFLLPTPFIVFCRLLWDFGRKIGNYFGEYLGG